MEKCVLPENVLSDIVRGLVLLLGDLGTQFLLERYIPCEIDEDERNYRAGDVDVEE